MEKRKIDREKFTASYNSDKTYAQICAEFKISLDTLRKRIKQYGLSPRRHPLSIDLEAFRESYYSGISSYKLAETFGICR